MTERSFEQLPTYPLELAALLIPSAHGDGKFWTDAAQTVVGRVIRSFIKSNQSWTLCDVVHTLRTPALIRVVLNGNGHAAETVLEDEKALAGILATIGDAMLPLADAIRESFPPKSERKGGE